MSNQPATIENTPATPVSAAVSQVESSRPVTATLPLQKLAYSLEEVCAVLGLSYATVHRLEKKRLLLPVPGVRVKLYTKESIDNFLSGKTAAA